MTKTFKVTLPLTVTLEIDANEGPATLELIRVAFAQAFDESAPYDPLAQTVIGLEHNSAFSVDNRATVKTAVLIGDSSDIEVTDA